MSARTTRAWPLPFHSGPAALISAADRRRIALIAGGADHEVSCFCRRMPHKLWFLPDPCGKIVPLPPKVLFERLTTMIKVAVRTLALLFMWQLAACATHQANLSPDEEGFSASASDYANAIMAGMERARAMRELRLQSSIAR
jgi:hypothetical protein